MMNGNCARVHETLANTMTQRTQDNQMERLTEGVLGAIRRIIQASDLHSSSIRRSAGITAPQLALLRAIANNPDATVGELSKIICLSQSTVTIVLDRLEEDELARRYRSDTDRRKVYAELTEKGALTLEVAPTPLQGHFIEQFESLMDHERTALLSSLQQIAAMMDKPRKRGQQDQQEQKGQQSQQDQFARRE